MHGQLLNVCCFLRQWAAALALHEEMRAAGHALNTTSYNALISAHSKAGELPAVLETYQRMVQQACALLQQYPLLFFKFYLLSSGLQESPSRQLFLPHLPYLIPNIRLEANNALQAQGGRTCLRNS